MNMPGQLSHQQAAFLLSPGLQQVCLLIEAAGGAVRIAGGAVRNALLGEPVGDVDLSTTLKPQHVRAVLEAGGVRVVDTGIDHGTVTAVIEGQGYEVTTLREDVETDGRHAVVKFGTDWSKDAGRRDLTMNALYCDRNGTLFDPLGGYDDLVARRVRFIGEAAARIAEDRLRILRFFRFFAWYGSGRPDAEGLKACAAAKSHIGKLSVERVWKELKKTLAAPDPSRAMLWMRTAGVLEQALPESGKWGIDALPAMVAAQAATGMPADPLQRLMAILPPRKATVTALATRLKLSNAERGRLLDWVRFQAACPDLTGEGFDKAMYAHTQQGGIDTMLLALASNDTWAKDAALQTKLLQRLDHARRWQRPQFPLSGHDLTQAGFIPGPKMGKALNLLEQRWIDSGFALDRQGLLALAADIQIG